MGFGKYAKIGAGITFGGCGAVFLLLVGFMAMGKMITEKQTRNKLDVPLTWQYMTTTDKMTNHESTSARVYSKEVVDLPFPYNGQQRAVLSVLGPGDPTCFISFEKGQIESIDLREAEIKIKVDNSPSIDYKASFSDSSGRRMVYILDSPYLFKEIAKGKTLVARVAFYQGGVHDFTFDVSGLKL